MKKRWARVVSILLAASIFVSVLPTNAFAVDEPAESFTIAFQKNGGKFYPGAVIPASFEAGQSVALPDETDITKPGYAFGGWFESPDFSGSAMTAIPSDKTEDVVLYARWDELFYFMTIPETVSISSGGAAVSLTGGGFYDGDMVDVSVSSQNNWNLAKNTNTLSYKMTETAGGLPLENGDEILKYEKRDTSDRFSKTQNLHFAVTGAARYAGNYSDTLTFTANFVGMQYTVTYHTGEGEAIEAQTLRAGTALSGLPVPAWAGHLFLAWCYDESLTKPVSDSDILLGNIHLYAKYSEVKRPEEQISQTFARALDQGPDFCIPVTSSEAMTAEEVKSALTLKNISATKQEETLSVTGSGTSFTVAAADGFKEGENYKLTLSNDCLSFAGQDPTVDEYDFTIAKNEVFNLSLNEDVSYVSIRDISRPVVNGAPASKLTVSVFSVGEGSTATESGESTVGSFAYTNGSLAVGSVIGVYEGDTAPTLEGAGVNEEVSFVEIISANGSSYTYRGAKAEDVLFTPDVLPVPQYADMDEDAENASITVLKSVFDYSTEHFSNIGLDRETSVDVNDYLAFYTRSMNADGTGITLVSYAEIDSVTALGDLYTVTYHTVSQQDMMAAMDVYRKEAVDGDELLEGSDPALIEQSVEEQALESGFAETAANYLAAAAMQTESYKKIADEYGITEDIPADPAGEGAAPQFTPISIEVSAPVLAAAPDTGAGAGAGAGAGVPAPSRVEFAVTRVQARLYTQLHHFENVGGLRLTLDIGVQIIIHAASTFDIVINIDGSFEQEASIGLNVDGNAVWKVWGIIPYIADYTVSAAVDLYEYTGINIEVSFQTQKADPENPTAPGTVPSTPGASGVGGGGGAGDTFSALGEKVSGIGDEMKNLMEKGSVYVSDDANILQHLEDVGDVGSDYGQSNVGKSLGEQYSEMLENNGDWVELYKQTLTELHFRVLLIIDIQFKIEFVVTANMNVTLGLDFWYENAKRYMYALDVFARKATNDTIDLAEEKYELSLYVMGTAGIRAGVRLTIAVGIFTTELACVGLTAEVGAYFRLWGYFYYTLTYTASAGKTSNFSGAIYMELGIYLEIKFLASAIGGTFAYNPTLYEEEWGLLKIGEQRNVTDYSYSQEETPELNLKRYVTRKKLPDSVFAMDYLDMKKGLDEDGNYFSGVFSPAEYYSIEMTNPAFSFDPDTNIVTANPGGEHELDGEMIITWVGTWSSVSKTPLQRRVKLHWDDLRDGYYIAFETCGGSDTDMIVAKYGAAVAAPENPTRQGYAFGGWYTDANCTVRYNMPSHMPNEDALVYAKWTPATVGYTVQHYKQSLIGSYELAQTESLTATSETTVTPGVKEYEGFTAPQRQSLYITPDGGATVSYYYARNKYQMTFDPANGREDAVMNTYSYGAALSVPTFRALGYTFAQWSAEVPSAVPASDMTFTASWTPSSNTAYCVRNYLQNESCNGYTLAEISYLKGTTGDTVTAPLADYTGYVLKDELPSAPIKADGSTTLCVYYDRGQYDAVYHTNGGTECPNTSAAFGAAVDHPITTKPGYGFAGCYTDDALENEFDGIMPIGGVELYAKWEAGSVGYIVRHLLQNAEDDEYTLDVTENLTGKGDTAVSPEVKTYAGFTSPAKQTVTLSVGSTPVVEYRYTRSAYTLKFVKENGEADAVSTVRFGASIAAPMLSRTGYTFAGWNETVPAAMPTSECTFTAQWSINSYTISFNTAGGSAVQPMTGVYGAAVTAPANPSRSGYTFTGWSGAVPSTIPAGNITLTANWSRDTYAISYNLASGTATGSNPTSYHVESGVITVANPTRTGYTFAGWTGTGISSATKSLTIPTGSTGARSYTATWTENSYTIKFQIFGQGATGSTAQMSMKYTASAPLSANGFTRTGYTFAGWSTTAGGAKAYSAGQTVSRLTSVSGGAVTLYPVWTANTYTLTYNGGGVIADATTTCTYDVNYTAKTASVNGYTFLGWAVGPSEPVTFAAGASFNNLAPSGNYVLYAKWRVNNYYTQSIASGITFSNKSHVKLHYLLGQSNGDTTSTTRVYGIPTITQQALSSDGYTKVTIKLTGHVKRQAGLYTSYPWITVTYRDTSDAWHTTSISDKKFVKGGEGDLNETITLNVGSDFNYTGLCIELLSGVAGPFDLTNYKIEMTFSK